MFEIINREGRVVETVATQHEAFMRIDSLNSAFRALAPYHCKAV